MGAVMVDDPALVLFAGGIGMEGTVVDANVDAFAVGEAERFQQPDSSRSADGGQGRDVLVEKDVLS